MVNHVKALANDILKGNVVLFVGAGLSTGAGLSGWEKIVRSLASEIDYKVPPEGQRIPTDLLIKIPQYYENKRSRSELIIKVKEITDTTDKMPTENHRLLVRLPIQTWVTTNWDDLLEQTLHEARRPYQKIVQTESLPYQTADKISLLKMHGDKDQENTIVITQEDYYSYSKRYPLIIRKLAVLLLEKTFLFVGYGLKDPDLNQLRAEIGYDLKEHQRWAYAIITDPYPDEFAVEDLERCNIHVIRATTTDGQDESQVLTAKLRELVETVVIPSEYEGLQNVSERTCRIIQVCQGLLSEPDKLQNPPYIVRIQASLSSLAISDKEEHEDRDYYKLILQERDSFLELMKAGAMLRCIISPIQVPASGKQLDVVRKDPMKRNLVERPKQLLRFLKDKHYFGYYEFVLFDTLKPNQIIFDRDVMFEGYKIGPVGGFPLTSLIRDPARIDFEVNAFDTLFTNLRTQILQTSYIDAQPEEAEEQEVLRNAAYRQLQDGLKALKASLGLG